MDVWITAGATLAAAAGTGLATFGVTRWSFNKKQRAETKRLARDVSTRFLAAVADIDRQRMGRMASNTIAVAERNEALKQALPELFLTAKQDREGAARKAQELLKTHGGPPSTSHHLRAVGDAMGCMDVMKVLIAEMQIIFPQSLLKKAETVAGCAVAASIMSELPGLIPMPEDTPINVSDPAVLAAKRDAAVKDFQNALRKSFDLDLLTG